MIICRYRVFVGSWHSDYRSCWYRDVSFGRWYMPTISTLFGKSGNRKMDTELEVRFPSSFCRWLWSHGGSDEKASECNGWPQRRGFGTEYLTGSVQANQVEHHQDHDHRLRVFRSLLVSSERLRHGGGKPATAIKLVTGYIGTVLPHINISLNPFIYAIRHEGVRRILSCVIICRKRDDVAAIQ